MTYRTKLVVGVVALLLVIAAVWVWQGRAAGPAAILYGKPITLEQLGGTGASPAAMFGTLVDKEVADHFVREFRIQADTASLREFAESFVGGGVEQQIADSQIQFVRLADAIESVKHRELSPEDAYARYELARWFPPETWDDLLANQSSEKLVAEYRRMGTTSASEIADRFARAAEPYYAKHAIYQSICEQPEIQERVDREVERALEEIKEVPNADEIQAKIERSVRETRCSIEGDAFIRAHLEDVVEVMDPRMEGYQSSVSLLSPLARQVDEREKASRAAAAPAS